MPVKMVLQKIGFSKSKSCIALSEMTFAANSKTQASMLLLHS